MRPRNELLLVLAGTFAAAVLAVLLAGPSTAVSTDTRASTFLPGPKGTKGLFEAVRGRGVTVRRLRQRPRELSAIEPRGHQLVALLNPAEPISGPERAAYLAAHRSSDLLLVGRGAEALMRCFGYRVTLRIVDSAQVLGRGANAPWVRAHLTPTNEPVAVDSSRAWDIGSSRCVVPPKAVATPLLTTAKGLAAVRIEPGDSGGAVILVADVALFQNRTVRDSSNGAGVFVLGLLTGGYDQVIFDEYHHGFGPSGSLAGATLAWSARSPWGWGVWQLAAVGLLALFAGAVRFGPAVPAIPTMRRNPLEHLRALATALSAARGHDEAIAAIVRGLRRRMTAPSARPSGDWRAWLTQLHDQTTSASNRESLARLLALTTPGQPASSVLQAAHAAEELWQSIRK